MCRKRMRRYVRVKLILFCGFANEQGSNPTAEIENWVIVSKDYLTFHRRKVHRKIIQSKKVVEKNEN